MADIYFFWIAVSLFEPFYPSRQRDGDPNTCHNASRSAAFRGMQRVGFLPIQGIILMTTTIHFSELNTEPVPLIPSGFGLPLLVLPSDFTSDLSKIPSLARLARLWSGGTFPILYRDHPLGHNNQFHPDLRGIPRFRVYLGTSTRML